MREGYGYDMTSETAAQRLIQLSTDADTRLWRNNVGEAWLGRNFVVRDGRLVSGDAMRVRYGLCVDSSDLIGPTSVIVTPEMLGTRVAIFTAIEVKSSSGRLSKGQGAFIQMVTGLGGRAGVARDCDEARRIITGANK